MRDFSNLKYHFANIVSSEKLRYRQNKMKNLFISAIFVIASAAWVNGESQVIQPRIVAGSATTPGEFPWTVSLQQISAKTGAMKHFCAGSIVDATHIVTAGHCVWNATASGAKIEVVAGAYDISVAETSQQRISVATVLVHPNYSAQGKPGPYDVAVLVLASALEMNDRVEAVALNAAGHFPSGKCNSMGWGNKFPVTQVYYDGSNVLLKGETSLIDKTKCQYLGGYLAYGTQLGTAVCGVNINLFTMTFKPLQGTCQGDSGGPVVCYNSDKTPYLAGIVSWGFIYCGISPDVYTDISAAVIHDWLDSVIATQTAA